MIKLFLSVGDVLLSLFAVTVTYSVRAVCCSSR